MKILLYMGHCVTKRTSQSFMELGDVLGLKQHVLGLISQKCHLWYHNIPRSFVVIVQSLSCPTLGDPMNCSTPGFPVHHHLLELAQTHLHWVSEAIQPSHILLSPSPLALCLSQHQGIFQWLGSLHQVAKVLEFQHQPFQWVSGLISFRIDWFDLLAVQGTIKNVLHHHSLKVSVLRH